MKNLEQKLGSYKPIHLRGLDGLKERLRPYTLAIGLAFASLYGCGGPTGTDAGNSDAAVGGDNPIANVSSSNITPAGGSSVGPDDFEFGVTVPGVNPDYTGTAPTGVEVRGEATFDNNTPSDPSDDETVVVFDQSGVPLETFTSGNVDVSAAHSGAGLADGEGVTLTAILTAVDDMGMEHVVMAGVEVVYEGSTNPVRVTGCNVSTSQIGLSLSIDCSCSLPADSWDLADGPDGAIITPSGVITAVGAMDASDVGLHTYTVTCTAPEGTSDDYVFTVPVDEHISRLVLHCQGDGDQDLRLPETSVDAVASACGAGFNPSLKPNTGADPDYVLDVDFSCVQGAITTLSAAERESHTHYNNGTTPDEVYSTCTVDFAQVRYISNN